MPSYLEQSVEATVKALENVSDFVAGSTKKADGPAGRVAGFTGPVVVIMLLGVFLKMAVANGILLRISPKVLHKIIRSDTLVPGTAGIWAAVYGLCDKIDAFIKNKPPIYHLLSPVRALGKLTKLPFELYHLVFATFVAPLFLCLVVLLPSLAVTLWHRLRPIIMRLTVLMPASVETMFVDFEKETPGTIATCTIGVAILLVGGFMVLHTVGLHSWVDGVAPSWKVAMGMAVTGVLAGGFFTWIDLAGAPPDDPDSSNKTNATYLHCSYTVLILMALGLTLFMSRKINRRYYAYAQLSSS